MASVKEVLIGEIALLSSGTVNVNTGAVTAAPFSVADSASIYRVTGTEVLVGNFVIAPTGTASKNILIKILWEASCTPGANTITIFGADVPATFAAIKFTAVATYNGAAWKTVLTPGGDETGYIAAKALSSDSISTAKVLDDAITNAKLANMTRGTVKVGGAANAPTDLDAKTSGRILVGDGTDLASVAVSGDATLASTGALTIANSAVSTAKIADAAVTPTKMSTNANTYTRDLVLSFQLAAEVGVLNYTINEACSIVDITTGVLAPPTGDDITLIFKNNGGTELTDSQTDITTAHVLGNQISVTPSANNTFAAGDTFTIEGTKTTKTSGKVNVAIRILKA
jgi:hypothetical protein